MIPQISLVLLVRQQAKLFILLYFILLIPLISNSTCIQGDLSCTSFVMIFVVMSVQVYLYSNYILTYILAGVFRFPSREFKTPEKTLDSSLQISRQLTHSSYHNTDHLTFNMQVDEDLFDLVMPHFLQVACYHPAPLHR
jgi:hypothetical protein